MIAAVLFISFALLLIMGAPIAICLGVSSIIAMLVQGAGRPLDTVMSAMPQMFSSSMSKFVLLAIPYFILAGNIMDKAQISKRLINLAEACVGHLRGGLAIVCVIVSCFFAAISGSGPATVAALGLVMIPGMIRSGYSAKFSAALMASAGAIGVIIPPSITFVVYGSIADASIGDLFKAGVVPGLIMGAALIATALILGRKVDLVKLPKASWHDRWVAFKKAFWGLLMPVIILGGIYGGIFTPTEAAAVSVVYGLVIGVFVYKTVKLKELWAIIIDSASTTATVLFITATASMFAYVLTRSPPRRRHLRRPHRAVRRQHHRILHHRQRHPAHCRLLPRLHERAVHLHPALRPRCQRSGHRPHPSRRRYDSQPRHRPLHPARRRQPVRRLRRRQRQPQADIEGGCTINLSIAYRPAAYHLHTRHIHDIHILSCGL